MLIVGLTGGIGCGKTTVAGMLADCGAGVISADEVARRLLWRSSPCFSEITKVFGKGILIAGRIDRRKLADIVFQDPRRRRQLEAILHPAARAVIEERCRRWREQKRYRVVALDVPLLFEAGWDSLVDLTVAVRVSEAEQTRRAARHLHLSPGDVRRRISAQLPLAEKIARAAVVIDNQQSRKHTRTQVRALWQDLMKMAKQ